MAQSETVQPILAKMSGPDEKTRLNAFRELFWTELNYEQGDQSIPTNGWTDHQKAGLLDLSRFAYYQSQFGRFDVIYCRLDKLSRVTEREIITKLMASYQFALFVFSNKARETWHFVNVKYAKDASARRLFRRITVGPQEQLRTGSERIAMLDVSAIAPDVFGLYPLTIQERHDQAFDVEAVTRAFYREYETVFAQAEHRIQGLTDEARRQFTQRLFNRLMFIRFVERKGWLNFGGSDSYLQALWKDYVRNRQAGETFYNKCLIPLFFAGLNTSNEVNIIGINGGGFLKDVIGQVPYLNGGLFEEIEPDRSPAVTVPDDILEPVVDGEYGLFYRFNFTVTESTPFDVEVAVDPEMLGKIFEELVTGRHESGSYYTPKTIVSFMGREAIRNYLKVQCPKETPAALSAFIDRQDATRLADPESVLDALKRIKICDPACGSGAYLLGMMHELLELRRNLFAARKIDAIGVYRRKLEIIQGNLYGVDIDLFAVNITRLRLWLSLIVDFEGDNPPPLPNLDYKVEVGNSLTAPEPMPKQSAGGNNIGIQLDLIRGQQIATYLDLKNRYLDAHGEEKKTLHAQVEAQRKDISEWMKSDRKLKDIHGFDWAVEFTEVFTTGGFDVIVANPPYVRQELIKDLKPALRSVYGDKFAGTADLYVYFYFRALQLLRSNGVLTFISSNKWMRAGYGEQLRETLSAQTAVENLIDFGDLPLFGAIAYPCVIVARNAAPVNDHSFTALNVSDLAAIDQLLYEVDARGWSQRQSSLDKDGWALMRPELLALLNKLRERGKPLETYVDGKVYIGVKTGFNQAFLIDAVTRDGLIREDARSGEIIKRYLRGRDVKRWNAVWSGQYIIFTRRGINIDEYPAVKAYLTQFKDRLMPGVSGGRKPGPYKWYEIQDNVAYHAEFEKHKIVWPDIAKRSEFTLDTSGSYLDMTLFGIVGSDFYLLGILNSKAVEWFFQSVTSTIQNGFFRFKRQYVEQIPIPDAPPALKKQIEQVVRSLLDAKGGQVTALEAELNALVNKAYGLMDSEIALIDESPQTIGQIQTAYPNEWLVIEITDRDSETNEPLKGYLRATGETQTDVFKAAELYKGKSLYVFYNEAQREAFSDEA
ncbi:MAG: Eco57I restriction-modification methylase domain-containing protein [Aggregatilineales bacterium]